MFGFLKKLVGKSAPAPVLAPFQVAPAAGAPAPALAPAARSAARPATPAASRTVMPAASSRPARPAPQPIPVAGDNTPSPVPVPSATPPPAIVVELSLKKLWTKLNPEILKAASGHPNGEAFLRLPLPLLQAQLVKGAIKLPFAQLRQYSPPGLFPANPEKDALEVEIPISEVLPLLKPEHFPRRPNQRKTEVPDDIGPIFGPDGGPAHGLRITADQKPRKPVTPAAVPPADAVPLAPFKRKEEPVAPVPMPVLAPVVPPAAAPASPIDLLPETEVPAPVIPVIPAPVPLRNDPIPAPKLDPNLASLKPRAPVPATVAPTASQAVKTPEGNFTIALMDVAAYWAENGTNDLANLYRHSLEIPMRTLESALKSGKLSFQWREIRPWVRLAPGNTLPSLSDDLMIELPLSIIAPRFMEQRGHAKQKNHADLIGDIPEVFEQKDLPAVNASSGPVLGATAVPLKNAADLAPGPVSDTAFLKRSAGKPLLEFGEIFGQPEKRNWTMAEVAQKAMTLRGVAGAIIASSEGLIMAGSWPGLKSDAVAGLVPQMFGRVLNFTNELCLGEPSNFTLMIENTPLQIFKTGTAYFTVIGRAGENLPKAQLNAVAMRLATTTK